MKLNSAIITTILVVLFSCKKDNTTTPSTTPPPTGGTTNTNVSAISAVATLFTLHYDLVVNGVGQGTNTTTAVSSGAFYTSPTNDPMNIYPNTDAGIVSLNGIQLKKSINAGSTSYLDTTYSFAPAIVTWSATGSTAIPAFSLVDSTQYPTYTGWGLIPSGARTSANMTMTLSNYSNADEVNVSVSDGVKSVNQHYYTIPSTATVPASKLAALSPTTNGYVLVTFFKNTVKTVAGKTIKLQKAYAIYKSPLQVTN